MGWKRCSICLLFVLVPALLSAGEEPVRPGAVEAVRGLLDSVRLLAETRDEKAAAELSRAITARFDVADVCKSALRGTWDALPEQERRAFTLLFEELLEKVAYPKSADFFKGTEVEVERVSLKGVTVQVDTAVEHPKEGMVEVTFCMAEGEGRWLVRDIHLDGVSLVLDIRSQMQKILREHSYAELKRRMREKIEEEA